MRRFIDFCVFSISLPLFACFADEPACMKDLERDFFSPLYVDQALSLHQITQSAWPEINRVLAGYMRNVPRLVRERAEKMNPNPLNIPFQWIEASHLMQDVLLEVFSQTLAQFNIYDQGTIKEMFESIRLQQMHRLIACFGEEKPKSHK